MINSFSITKNIAILLVLLVGALYSLPNIFGEDYAVQISADRGGRIDTGTLNNVENLLSEYQILGSKIENSSILVRFANQDDQRAALEHLSKSLGNRFVVALNLAPKTPQWLRGLGGEPMNLGLDLRGGVHFLLEVDMKEAINKQINNYITDTRTMLRKSRIRFRKISKHGEFGFRLILKSEDYQSEAEDILKRAYNELVFTTFNNDDGFILIANINEDKQRDIRKFALQQNITTLRNRVNELGVSEPIIQQQGQSRIVVQLPGIQDTTRAKDILGATATLDFRLVDEKNDPYVALETNKIPPLSILRKDRDDNPVLLQRRVITTGDSIIDAASGFEQQNNTPAVFITLDAKGARRMSNSTRDNIGKRMAVVFIENKVSSKMVDGERVRSSKRIEEVINVAVIQDQLSSRFQVTGLDSSTEARDLALFLRAGSLAVPMEIIEERTVGPSLGKENIDKGLMSVIVGLILVLVFMVFYYRVFGLIANLALVLNIVLVVSLLSIIQAVLTLPGIAGIVLTIGMAVDANVLIFERIREEIRAGNSPQASIHSGYDKAFSTIMDANVTTLIAAIVLFAFGTGTIKGFAITLALGIVTSMFTAILGTRAVINLVYGRRNISKLHI